MSAEMNLSGSLCQKRWRNRLAWSMCSGGDVPELQQLGKGGIWSNQLFLNTRFSRCARQSLNLVLAVLGLGIEIMIEVMLQLLSESL